MIGRVSVVNLSTESDQAQSVSKASCALSECLPADEPHEKSELAPKTHLEPLMAIRGALR